MKLILSLLFASHTILLAAQQEIILYPGNKIPGGISCHKKETVTTNASNNRISIGEVIQPTLAIYRPATNHTNRSAVIICPGGGYARLAMTHEGYDVATAFNNNGITAFVLKYRLPDDSCMTHKENGPLQDLQQAIIYVKTHAGEWGIDSAKVGVLGFSAGGHLASTATTHYTTCYADNPAAVSVRPAFAILFYPVISFTDELAHAGSRDRLLGRNPTKEKIDFFSNEKQITPATPPCFLVHAADDKTVPVKNSMNFYTALLDNKIKASLLIYQSGGHGFGMTNPDTKENWLPGVVSWMRLNQF